jgi:hypothetical protein
MGCVHSVSERFESHKTRPLSNYDRRPVISPPPTVKKKTPREEPSPVLVRKKTTASFATTTSLLNYQADTSRSVAGSTKRSSLSSRSAASSVSSLSSVGIETHPIKLDLKGNPLA